MRLTWIVVPIGFVALVPGATPWGLGQPSTAGSSGQTPKKPTSAQTTALTPQEREAQKHYRVALEAIKNNDFSTAAGELKAASELAPKNALIWYNLAVVESKKGDSASALQHLQKAENLKLPKNLSNDADELEAKLSYEVKRESIEEAFHGKILELQQEMKKSASDQCIDDQSADIVGNEAFAYSLASQAPPRTALVGIYYNSYTFFQRPFQGIRSLYINGTATFNFADLSPDFAFTSVMFCHSGKYRWLLTIKAKKQEGFHLAGKRHEHVPPLQGGTGEETETPLTDGDTLELSFSSQDSAQAAANTISELIRMSQN